MTEFLSVSHTDLIQRRKQLRNQRRLRNFQAVWQMIAVSSLSAGLAWVLTLPGWVIATPEQVEIKGNRFLSTKAILALLPLSYPQSLLQVQPQALAEKLEAAAPIRSVTVTRQLIPPKMMVQVRERLPVAVTVPAKLAPRRAAQPTQAPKTFNAGLLDENGKWMPFDSYSSIDKAFKLPSLKVIGMSEAYTPYWSSLYRLISRSSVKILEIDWRDSANLILKTEVGTYHLGPYSAIFAQQLNVIERMRKLPQHFDSSRIAYIDLKNPETPIIQVTQSKSFVKPRRH
ncbi:cell division protein FtsQ [Leptolyngbya sp. 'hensonii']|uniref:cell division protein FtsQ/DivIB n=1 Tax=Leptolyngbya sp. 'hensonii' TaxID=1922337 RepID=UPI00094F5270|nr:FtsQ-type POTRA domain-containing protein [Leptolyngbya sp. 'hensonii']OLP17898.1 cell division protein FtsQ [Leptolyngbya sp. 'hensonii']